MPVRVAVDFARRGLKDTCSDAFGEPEHVQRAENVGLHSLDRIELIMNRRCGARQIIDLIDFKQDRLGHVMTNELK